MKIKSYLVIVLLLLGFFVFCPTWIILSEIAHYRNQQKLQTSAIYKEAAKQLALTCQSVQEEMNATETNNAWIPAVVRELNPSYGTISPEKAYFEMHGGFDHYGYRLDLNKSESNDKENVWELYYNKEGKEEKFLCKVKLNRNEKIPVDEFIAEAVQTFDKQVKMHPNDLCLHRDRVLFLLGYKRLDHARKACLESRGLMPDSWWPRLTLAFLDSRLGNADHAVKEFSSWVEKNPSFDHFFCLYFFYKKERRTDDAIAAFTKALDCPFTESGDMDYNIHFLSYDAASFACQSGKYPFAIKICKLMETGGPYYSRSSFLPKFQKIRAVAETRLAEETTTTKDIKTLTSIGEEDDEFNPYKDTSHSIREGKEAFILYSSYKPKRK